MINWDVNKIKTLEGDKVILSPMNFSHAEGLVKAANFFEIWKNLPALQNPIPTIEMAYQWIEEALNTSNTIAFTILNKKNEVIGSTRYLDIQSRHEALEIGWTWLTPCCWGTGVNKECKLLLLQYAFEELNIHRVQLKTDARNIRSQKAIEKIGAKKEGVLRAHWLLPDGHRRDSVYYSILNNEWPLVKELCRGRFFP